MADDYTPATRSSAYNAMLPAWQKIDAILAGAEAVRAGGVLYLPKYDGETKAEYERRRMYAPWRPEFEDALRNLASRPFQKDVTLSGSVSQRIKDIAEDIDGQGNNLTQFAAAVFKAGLARGFHAILVDYPPIAPGATLADERASGARPYWVHVPCTELIALYTEFVNGREVITHARLYETTIVRKGYTEDIVERVREFNPGEWITWKRQTGADNVTTWTEEGRGTLNRNGNGSIPLVIFYAGERNGPLVKAPLDNVAEVQLELYRALSRKDEVMTYAGSPMLSANGMAKPPEGETIITGPKRILFAPPGGDGNSPSWDFIQPNAANIKEVREDIAAIVDDLRRLAMQPMVKGTGNPTATGRAIDAARSHSAVQQWALSLKDALEAAFVMTCEWLGEQPNVEVTVFTDFQAVPYEPETLRALNTARANKDLSQRTYWENLRRLNVLSSDFDPDAEEEALAAEFEGLESEEPIDPRTGAPLVPVVEPELVA
jgi:hypothetical protein